MSRSRWSKVLAWVGLAAMGVGALDPLEGSLVILPGAALAAAGAWLGGSRFARLLGWALALVAVGVGAMFGLSALGGVGGSSGHPAWWALVVAPYPAGWVLGLVGSVRRLREKGAAPAIRPDPPRPGDGGAA